MIKNVVGKKYSLRTLLIASAVYAGAFTALMIAQQDLVAVAVGVFGGAFWALNQFILGFKETRSRLLSPLGNLSASEIAEIQGASALTKLLPSNYVVWRNVFIPSQQSSVGAIEVDILVISPAGVFAFEVKSHEGKVYADNGARQWKVVSANGVSMMRNPVQQAQSQVRAIEGYLKGQGVEAKAYSAVFMPNAEIVTEENPMLPIYKKSSFLPAFVKAKDGDSSLVDIEHLQNILYKGHAAAPKR